MKNKNTKNLLIVTGFLVFSVLYFIFFKTYYPVKFIVEVRSDAADIYQLFWDTGRGFNETQSVRVPVFPSVNHRRFIFNIPSCSLKRLRFDPGLGGNSKALWIKEITLLEGDKAVSWKPEQLYKEIGDSRDIMQMSVKNNSLHVRISGSDPQIIFTKAFTKKCGLRQNKKEKIKFYFFILTAFLVFLALVKITFKRKIIPLAKKYELLFVFVIFSIMILFLLGPAIITGMYFAPANIIRVLLPFIDGTYVHNILLGDILLAFLPWYALCKKLLWDGAFPFWNIYSGGGLPLFANMESAVLCPITWLYYIFSIKTALLLSSYIKLILIGLFTYLYLRELKCKKLPALGGAIGFMFAGFNIVWLLWPMPGVIIALPTGLFLIERFFKTKEIKYGLFLALILTFGVSAGHPETLFHIAVFLTAYTLLKIFTEKVKMSDKFKYLFFFLSIALIAVVMSLVFIFPCFEYLKHSGALFYRSVNYEFFLPKLSAILNAIPDFYGNPSFNNFYFGVGNYNELASGFVGTMLLASALCAVIWNFRNKYILFYASAFIIAFSVIYKIFPVFNIVTSLPVFRVSANHRLLFILAFSVAILGALGFDHFARIKVDNRKLLATLLGLFLTVSALYLLNRTYQHIFNKNIDMANFWQLATYLIFVLSLFIAGLVLKYARHEGVLFVFFIFFETGVHGMTYNSLTKDQDFFPENNAVSFLQKETALDNSRVLFMDSIFFANLGTWYGINQFGDYDAIYLKESLELKQKAGIYSYWPRTDHMTKITNNNILKLLSVKYIVYPNNAGSLPALSSDQKAAYSDGQVSIVKQSTLPRVFFIKASNLKELKDKIINYIDLGKSFSFLPADDYRLQQNGNSEILISAPCEGYVFLNENYFPGWQAEVDGKKTKIENVAGLKAILVNRGQHVLKITYYPLSFYAGAVLSIIGFILWLILYIWKRRSLLNLGRSKLMHLSKNK